MLSLREGRVLPGGWGSAGEWLPGPYGCLGAFLLLALAAALHHCVGIGQSERFSPP